MYPGYPMGCGAALEAAMDEGLRLAVDVSHVFMQREQGVLGEGVWRRLQDYERIEEIHLSANDGRRDSHAPVTQASYGLDWARKRSSETSTPAILECYMHKLSTSDRLRQIEFVRGS